MIRFALLPAPTMPVVVLGDIKRLLPDDEGSPSPPRPSPTTAADRTKL
jgi:hypothetical protein